MYAVIFKAKISKLDSLHSATALRMRELAMDKYACTDFISVIEKDIEISISYWEKQENIKNWKQDAEHLVAQELGHSSWYEDYKIEIVKVIREYDKSTYQQEA